MKSNKIVFFVFSLFFLASAVPSLAIAGPKVSPVQKRDRIEAQDPTGPTYRNRNENQNRFRFLTEAKAKVFEKIYTHLRESLEHGLQVRLEQKAKVEARTATREKEGKDMTAAKTKLGEFTGIQTAYNSAMTALEAKYQEIVDADTSPFTQMRQLRAAAQNVRQELTNMRHLLTETIKLIIKP